MLLKNRCAALGHSVPLFKRFLAMSSASPFNSLTEVVQKLNAFAPLTLAESWDNVGLLIEPATPKYVPVDYTYQSSFYKFC